MELGKQISLISFAWEVLVVCLFLIYEVSIYINVLCCNLASKPPTSHLSLQAIPCLAKRLMYAVFP